MQEYSVRIAVVGVGAVGGYFGGHLAHAGENVVFVERGRTLQALRENGLRVDSVEDNFVVRPARATGDPSSAGAMDVVLLAVKGWQVPGAIETVRPLMGPDTFVVPLMDGVALEGAMREVVAVGRAHDARVSDDAVKRSLALLDQAPATAIGNLRDIIDGRPSELETEIGAIVRLARSAGIEVPCHAVLYASLLPQERKARGEIEFPAMGKEPPKAA